MLFQTWDLSIDSLYIVFCPKRHLILCDTLVKKKKIVVWDFHNILLLLLLLLLLHGSQKVCFFFFQCTMRYLKLAGKVLIL